LNPALIRRVQAALGDVDETREWSVGDVYGLAAAFERRGLMFVNVVETERGREIEPTSAPILVPPALRFTLAEDFA
jgi:hypothetical protein